MNKISIITSVLNGEKTIRTCLKSVASQSMDVEHIIVDGQSTDRTLDAVKEFGHVAKVISEKDKGVYDGLNKGLGLASGQIIGFLHADDFFADSHILEKISNMFANHNTDSCYGDLAYVSFKDTSKIFRYWKAGEYNSNKFYNGWMPPHPTFFVRKKIYDQYGGFRLDLGTAGDYELMLRFLVKNKISTHYLPEIVTKMRVGGLSNASLSNRVKANRNDRKAWDINGLNPLPWTILCKPLRKIGQFIK